MRVPERPIAIAEVKELMATPNHILSPKNGKSIICLVQDAILSMYLMTKREGQIKKEVFDQLLIDIEELSRYELIVSILGRAGRVLLSFLLPQDLNFSTHTVVIQKDLLVKGLADSDLLGSPSSSILKCLFEDYGPQLAGNFIDECQFISNRYMLYTGYSGGVDDCIAIPTQGYH